MTECIDDDGDKKNDMNLSSTSDTEEDDRWSNKRKRKQKQGQKIMLNFQNGASCMTLVNMAVSKLLQHVHECSASMWLKLENIKVPTGLAIYQHVENQKKQNGDDCNPTNDFLIHMGCATVAAPAKEVFELLSDPLCRFSYDIMVNMVQLMEKLDDDTYILRLLHENKQCFLKTERETIVVIRNTVIIPDQKFIIAAVSIEHPAYPTENGQRFKMMMDDDEINGNGNVNGKRRQRSENISKGASMCMNSGYQRTEVRPSGWIIERDEKNKYQSQVKYITDFDFGGNVPSSIKRTVAKKLPLAIYHLAKALKKRKQLRRY